MEGVFEDVVRRHRVIVLAYLGIKTFAGYFGLEVPTLWNMAVVLGTIGFFIVLSLIYRKKGEGKPEERKMVH